MAGGIDWFRWHHGTVTDQKFPLVARRAGASVAEVIAVWACLLERASMNEHERGWLGESPDFEAMDCALGMADGKASAIFDALRQRDLVDGNMQITAWPKRQPKRERDDDTAAERKRRQREREAASGAAEEPHEATREHVTPSHTESHQKPPRGEERREELSSSLRSEEKARKRAAPPPDRPTDVDEQTWADWLQLRRQKRAPVTPTVLDQARQESEKAGLTLQRFLAVWCSRGSQGLQAEWLKPHERAQAPPAETPYQRSMRERAERLTGGLASARPPSERASLEVFDVTAKRLG